MYLEQLLKNDSFENTEEVLLKFITDIILSGFKHGDAMFSYPSRHAILHGADTSYGKESISLKTILVLDILTRKFEFVAFDNSNLYHRPNCSLVKHRKEKRTFYTYEFQAEMEGKTSCKSCI